MGFWLKDFKWVIKSCRSHGLWQHLKYPSCYGPESHFHLPLVHDSDVQAWSTSPLPRTTEIIHYSLPITISSPLFNSGSLLTWISRMETMLENTNPITGPLANLPVTREEANARNIPGPTQEDFLRAHRNQVHAPERCNLNIQILYDDEENFCTPEHPTSRHGSRRYDEDWYRMVSCCDPWETKPLLRGPVHRPGSLTGSWAGTFLVSVMKQRLLQWLNSALYIANKSRRSSGIDHEPSAKINRLCDAFSTSTLLQPSRASLSSSRWASWCWNQQSRGGRSTQCLATKWPEDHRSRGKPFNF